MTYPILTVAIRFEQDIVLARQRARQIANLLGFDVQEQTRIATAVSEVARNAFQYAGGGKVEFCIEGQSPQSFFILISDRRPGIADVQAILDGKYRSQSGMGLGLIGAQRLIDEVRVDSSLVDILPRISGRGIPRITGKDDQTDRDRLQPKKDVESLAQSRSTIKILDVFRIYSILPPMVIWRAIASVIFEKLIGRSPNSQYGSVKF